MFTSAQVLQEHKITNHEIEIQNDKEDHSNDLVWVKLAALYWPAKILRKIGELTVIRLFDDDETEQTVENIKLKPFEKLGRIPAQRNPLWKAAYSKQSHEQTKYQFLWIHI